MHTLISLVLGAALALFDPGEELPMSLDWTREREPPYPNLVAMLRHDSGATLTVGRQFLGVGEDGESFARGNAQALVRMGFKVRRDGHKLDARAGDGERSVHQEYVVHATIGWVVTLSGTPAQIRALRRDFAAVVARIEEAR